jgi:hypothetical protein
MQRKQFKMGRFFMLMALVAAIPLLVARYLENARRNAPKTPYVFPVTELAALDQVVQARFAVIPEKDFGVSRIGKRHEVFVPQTAQEKSVVAALKRRGYEVVFYVAGRGYLKDQRARLGPHFLQGPIFITRPPQVAKVTPYTYMPLMPERYTKAPSATPLPGLPGGGPIVSPLKAPAQEAFWKFETSDGTDFQAGKWNIVARPVRASSQTCVDCHNSRQMGRGWPFGNAEELKLGDTLGVAMYAYRRKSES